MTLSTEFVFELRSADPVPGRPVSPIDIITVGSTPSGQRRIVPIVDAIIEGPAMRGIVLPQGADRQVTRPDGVLEMNAIYDIKTDDGVVIQVVNKMIRHAPAEVMQRLLREEVDASEYYFRGTPVLIAPEGKYDWVNRTVFVSSGIRTPSSVRILFYRVL